MEIAAWYSDAVYPNTYCHEIFVKNEYFYGNIVNNLSIHLNGYRIRYLIPCFNLSNTR